MLSLSQQLNDIPKATVARLAAARPDRRPIFPANQNLEPSRVPGPRWWKRGGYYCIQIPNDVAM